MDRTQLFDSLSNLPTAAFERLLVAVNMPRMNRAGAAAKIGDQVSALLEWADSNIGPGLEAIAHHLAELSHFEFDAYLRSLVTTYEKWWEHYTLTDAIGKVEPTEKPSAFDFGLMVQTVTKEREPTDPENTPLQQDKEKTERLPVLEGIRKYADDHVLLVGRPGSGKSTALIRLLLEEAANASRSEERYTPSPSPKLGRGEQERIPVLVELRYWGSSIEGLIQGFLQRHNLALDDATLSTLLSEGQFLLLVDGLNELPSEEARTQLSAFRRNHPKLPMIFTTRDLGLGGDLGIEKKLEMQPLTEAQMKAFIRAYVPDQAETMLRQLSDRLREFGQTPLLLWMLCEVFQQSPNRQMPTNLAEVFRAFTTMYEDSSVRKHEVALLKGDVRPLSDRRLWKDALKALAALMMQGETPVDFRVAIHRTEAERELSKVFANEKFHARDILDDLLKYHLLQNRTTDQLEFRHQLIQEYYAAEHLLDLLAELSDEQLKRDYLNLLKWTEAIALMLALVNKESQAIRMVKLAVDDVDLLLGAKLAGNVKLSFQDSILNNIFSQFSFPQFPQKYCYLKLLGCLKFNLAILILERMLLEEEAIACLAIKRIAKSDNKLSEAVLIKALTGGDSNICQAAARAIADNPGKIKSSILEQIINNKEENLSVRVSLVQALSGIYASDYITSLKRILDDDDEDPNLQSNAIFICKNLLGNEKYEYLEKILCKKDQFVGWAAIQNLDEFDPRLAQPILSKALFSEQPWTRMNAAFALSMLRCENASMEIVKAINREISVADQYGNSRYGNTYYNVISNLIQALGDTFERVAEDAVLELSFSEDSNIRMTAIRALGKIKTSGSFLRLKEILKDQSDANFFDFCTASEVIGNIDGEAVFSILESFLSSEKAWVREAAVSGMERIQNDGRVIPALSRVLLDSHNSVRYRTAIAFDNIASVRKIDCSVTIRNLTALLFDSNAEVRFHAAQALWRIESVDDAIDRLIVMAQQEEKSNVRMTAVRALGKASLQRSNEIISILLCALADSDLGVRMCAAEALSEIAQPEHLNLLRDLSLELLEDDLDAAISAIQNRYKYYNHEIWQAYLASQQDDNPADQSDGAIANTITIQTVEKLTIMSDKAPIFNQQNATIGVNYAAEGSQQDFTQHIYVPEQNFEILLTNYKHFINELQQQNPHITNETTIIQTIDIESRRIDTRWQNFLNLKRLWNGGKKAAIKVGEHFVESNPWGKGAIAFLEGVSEDVK